MPGRWPPLESALLRQDALAGITLGLLLVPQSLAYAHLAGLPPVHGLYCALLPVVVGALAGWCHQLQTGPAAMTAILVASTIAPVAAAGSEAAVAAAALLALLVGAVRIALGLLKAADLTRLVSHPVLAGFTAAAALVIASTQVPALLGRPGGEAASPLLRAVTALAGTPEAWTLAMGAGSLAALLALRRWPRIPGALLVAGAAIAAGAALGYPGAVVGPLPSGLPAIALPPMDPALALELLPGAVLVTLIGFAEVLAVTRVAATRTRQAPRLDRELIGQGAAAVAAGVTTAFPPSGSLSRSALALGLGARTALAGVISAAVVLAVLLGGTGLLAPLPYATLAALILVAVIPLADPRPLLRAWRAHPHDGIAGIATFVLTLALAPALVDGFLIGAGIAILLFLWRLTRPRVADCARHPDGTWRDWRRMGLVPAADLCVLRPDARICFATAAAVEDAVHRAVAERPQLRALVLACESVNELDASGCETLRSLVEELGRAGIVVAMAGLKTPVEETARRTGLLDLLGGSGLFRTTDQAVQSLVERIPLAPPPWSGTPA